jgi:hypothetical protein
MPRPAAEASRTATLRIPRPVEASTRAGGSPLLMIRLLLLTIEAEKTALLRTWLACF